MQSMPEESVSLEARQAAELSTRLVQHETAIEHPERDHQQKLLVAQKCLRGASALVAMDEVEVPEDAEQHEARAVAQHFAANGIGSLRFERIHHVADRRHCEENGRDLVEEGRGIPREHSSMPARVITEQDELVPTLCESEVEREETATQEKPYRRPDVDRGGAGKESEQKE